MHKLTRARAGQDMMEQFDDERDAIAAFCRMTCRAARSERTHVYLLARCVKLFNRSWERPESMEAGQ